MNQLIQTHKRWLMPAGFAAIVVVVILVVVSRTTPANAAPLEMTLIAKDVAFYLAGHPDEPNPPIQLTRGRPVKLILRNDEPEKVLHCFTIGGLDVATSRNLATGESETLTFTPNESGTFAYACLMHGMMTGRVVVE